MDETFDVVMFLHSMYYVADVEKAFVDAGIAFDDVVTLDALVDLASATDEVLDFAVQALTPELHGPVRAYLDAVSVPGSGGGLRVPHPVDVFGTTRR